MALAYDGLTKLIEECGELIQISAKKQAFFTTDEHPDKNGSMNERLENEISDVLAAIAVVIENFKLSENYIYNRAEEKRKLFRQWHESKK